MDRFAFLSGLPRTGSTLLGTLLAQHPDLHSTRTSCIRNLIEYTFSFSLGESPYFDRKDPDSQCWGLARGILFGAYDNVNKPVVIEKDRGWAGNIDVLERVLGEKPKILAPVRSIPEIIASFILISKKIGSTSKIEDEVKRFDRESNPWTLSRVIWERYLYPNWRTFKFAFEKDPDCFLLIDYNDLVANPQKTMDQVFEYLEVSPWQLATENLKNPNPENDAVYGMPGLHFIRPELKRTSPPAEEVLGKDCFEFWANQEMEFWKRG